MATTGIGRASLALVGAVVLASVAVAAQGRGAGMPRYDKATETTVSGTVEQVQPHQGRKGGTGLHLSLRTASGVLDVHVGPTRWLDQQKFEFASGDALDVLGSRIQMGGTDVFLARQITKGGQTMTLRDENGLPRWSMRGGRTN